MVEWKLADSLTIRDLASFEDQARPFVADVQPLHIDASGVAHMDILGLQALISVNHLMAALGSELKVSISKGGAIDQALAQFGFCQPQANQAPPAPFTYQDVAA